MSRTINLTGSDIERLNSQMAHEQQIPMGQNDCYRCYGQGYFAALSGPIPCPCAKRKPLLVDLVVRPCTQVT